MAGHCDVRGVGRSAGMVTLVLVLGSRRYTVGAMGWEQAAPIVCSLNRRLILAGERVRFEVERRI